MPDILHRVGVAAEPKRVFEALMRRGGRGTQPLV